MSAHWKSTRRAQRATMDFVKDLLGLSLRLHEISEDIPLRFGTDDMVEDDVPRDIAFNLHGRIQTILTHELAELIESLSKTATVSQEDLDRGFLKRKRLDAAYRASRTS